MPEQLSSSCVSRYARLPVIGYAVGALIALGGCGEGRTSATVSRSAQSGQASNGRGAASPPGSTRTYSGEITLGTGRYARAQGAMDITLILRQTAPARYAVSIGLHGGRCAANRQGGGAQSCLVLAGTVTGSALAERAKARVADLPARIGIAAASGRVSPLGPVAAQGEMSGVGFIRSGRRSLSLTLAAKGGTVAMRGVGPLVPGFSPP